MQTPPFPPGFPFAAPAFPGAPAPFPGAPAPAAPAAPFPGAPAPFPGAPAPFPGAPAPAAATSAAYPPGFAPAPVPAAPAAFPGAPPGFGGYPQAAPAFPAMPGALPVPSEAFLDGLNSAKPPADRLPRIEAGAVADVTIERVHLVPIRGGKTFFEIVMRVDRSNHPRMPEGHVFSIFQHTGYDGAQGLIRSWVLAMLGHPPTAQLDVATATKHAISAANPLAGAKVRARAVAKSPSKGNNVGKTFVDCMLEPPSANPLPGPVAAEPVAPAAPAPAAPAPAAPATWRDPSGQLWDVATRQPIPG